MTAESSSEPGGSLVYLARSVDGPALLAVFAALRQGLGDGKVGVKLSSG